MLATMLENGMGGSLRGEMVSPFQSGRIVALFNPGKGGVAAWPVRESPLRSLQDGRILRETPKHLIFCGAREPQASDERMDESAGLKAHLRELVSGTGEENRE